MAVPAWHAAAVDLYRLSQTVHEQEAQLARLEDQAEETEAAFDAKVVDALASGILKYGESYTLTDAGRTVVLTLVPNGKSYQLVISTPAPETK